MKIERVTVSNEEGGKGTLVDLRLRLFASEEFNSLSVSRIIAAITEAGSRDPLARSVKESVERANALAEAGYTAEADAELSEAGKIDPAVLGSPQRSAEAASGGTESPTDPRPPTETEASPRRRRRASAESDQSNSAASTAGPSADATTTSSGQSDANPTRRRRTGGAETATEQAGSTETSPSATAPQAAEGEPRRRRRAAASSETATTTAGTPATEETAGTSTRRRRPSGADGAAASAAPATTAKSPSDDKITDADLSKACSDAARVLTPKVVMEYLGTFGAKQAGELKGDDRRKFLDGLKAKKGAA